MALVKIQFSSKLLENQTTVRLLLPDRKIVKPLPVIWWLHGLGDNGNTWLRKTRIELFAEKYNIAIIFPDMQRSFYLNIQDGLPFYTYLTDELYHYLYSVFPFSTDPNKNFLVGNSMGGFGAYKWSFTDPHKFSYIATMSPVTNLSVLPKIMPDYQIIESKKTPSLYNLALSNKNILSMANWLNLIGDSDPLLNDDQKFVNRIKKLGINLNMQISSGKHDWTFWDKQIEKIFDWLPLEKF